MCMCRVPCEYRHRSLSVRVDERSRGPNELTICYLNQGGQTDIVSVDVAQVKTQHSTEQSLTICKCLCRRI